VTTVLYAFRRWPKRRYAAHTCIKFGYQLYNSPFYASTCFSPSQLLSPQTHTTKTSGYPIRQQQFSLNCTPESWRPIADRWCSSCNTQDAYLNIPARAPSYTGRDQCRGWGKHCVRRFPWQPQMAAATRRRPWAPLHSIQSVLFIRPSFLHWLLTSVRCGYRPGAGGIIHKQSDLAAVIEIRLRTAGSRVQLPEGQKIYLYPTTVRLPLDPPSLLFAIYWGSIPTVK